MEAPRFIKNKTAGFSSAVLALSLIACSDSDSTKVAPTPTEQGYVTSNLLIGPLKDQNIDQSTLDHTCGISLSIGEQTHFRIPTTTKPYEIDFDLTVTETEDGNFSINGLRVDRPMYFGATTPGNTKGIALGYLLPLPAQGELFFSPFIESKQFLVDGCPQTT